MVNLNISKNTPLSLSKQIFAILHNLKHTKLNMQQQQQQKPDSFILFQI